MCNLLAVDGVRDPGVASINAGGSSQSVLLAFCLVVVVDKHTDYLSSVLSVCYVMVYTIWCYQLQPQSNSKAMLMTATL